MLEQETVTDHPRMAAEPNATEAAAWQARMLATPVVPYIALLTFFHRIAGILPCFGPAEHGVSVCDPFLVHLECQTGTRVFGRSGTIDDYLFTFGYL